MDSSQLTATHKVATAVNWKQGEDVVIENQTEGKAMRILVLGAGFGGLELTTRLSAELGDDADIVLIDKANGFVFGFSKLDVMFGRTAPGAVRHLYRDLVKPGVRFVQSTIRAIDPVRRRVETDAGPFQATCWLSPWGPTSTRRRRPGW